MRRPPVSALFPYTTLFRSYGIDMDDSTIPQEAGLNERAVSFTKGCYLGQETVARLYYRGKPNRHLRGLRLSSAAATGDRLDRKSTRLNSSHSSISYAVFCL